MFDKPWQGSQSPSSPAPNVTIGARELIESAPDIIFACDAEGRFQWLNAAVEAHLGKRPADLLGRLFTEVVAPEGRRDAVRFYLAQERDSKGITSNDIPLVSSEGRDIVFSTRVRRVERPDGETIYVGCARPAPPAGVRPVAGTGAAESASGGSPYAGPYGGHSDLELTSDAEWIAQGMVTHGAGETPAASAQPALGDDARAPRLENALGNVQVNTDFLTTMGEEMRSPVNGIFGTTELLLESEMDPDQRAQVEMIQTLAQSLLNLLNDTLEFTKLEKSTFDVQKIDFDLRHTVNEVATLVAPLANEKGLGFDCRVHHEVPSLLRGDPAHIRQVIQNLASSAIRLTESGQIRIVVERLEEDDASVSLRFTLHDSGLGLDDGSLGEVFDAWARDDEDSARKQGATGVALALSRKIVLNMKGEVGVVSERVDENDAKPTGGTRFWFSVPLEKQADKAAAVAAENVQLRNLKVLVVDPSAESSDETLGMLRAWGCRPESVSGHSDALQLLRKAAGEGNPFDLALIEKQLAEVDGEGLGRIIRGDDSLSQTQLILLTAIGSRGDAQRAQEAGFAAYLVRPVSWSSLYDAVVEVMHSAIESASAPAQIVTRHSVAEARRGRVRILLVEDNAVNLMVAKSLLTRLGFNVETATNGAEAIAAVENDQFDLILMDLQMPEVDGYKATAALRARERGHQRTPIVAMTATATPEERDNAIAAGMDEYLAKPLQLGQLAAVVESLVAKDEPWAYEPTAPTPPPSEAPETFVALGPDEDVMGAASGAGMAQGDGDGTDVAPGDVHGPALEMARLEESCMGIAALRDTLLKAFLGDVWPRFERLQESVQRREVKRVEFEAHGLKGMCATIGATSCRMVFAEMEEAAHAGALDDAARILPRAQKEIERAEKFIKRLEEVTREAA